MNKPVLKIFFSQNNTFLTLVDYLIDGTLEPAKSNSKFRRAQWVPNTLVQPAAKPTDQIIGRKSRFSRLNKHSSELPNTLIKTAPSAKVLVHLSAGICGARNSKKTALVDPIIRTFLERTPIRSFEAEVRGFSPIRENFLNALFSTNAIQITKLTDTTSIAHNGCRIRRKRRL